MKPKKPREKPSRPTPDFPLFPHASGQWAKKVKGRMKYFGPWDDPDAALACYQGQTTPTKIAPAGKSAKRAKPHKDYPLYRHKSGQWAKRVLGNVHYFGTDPDAALAKWLKQKDDLLAGREPPEGDGLTIGRLSNLFLEAKERLRDSGELKPATWYDYSRTCDRIIKVLGPGRHVAKLRPIDFERLRADFAKTHNATTLSDDITRAWVLFKYAYSSDLVDRPVKYGDGFKKPSKATLRKERLKKPRRMFQADELRKIIDKAGVQLRAMVYLGINCGLGNNDCMMLPRTALNLKKGWLDFGRPKTGVPRRCPLWKETVAALQATLDARPTPKDPDHAGRVFITKYGATWEPKTMTDNPVSKETAKVLEALKIHRKGLGFYALRHTFQTIGGKRDKDATRAIMGHVEDANDMSAVYNEEPVDDARLRAVTDFVHDWLFPVAKDAAKDDGKA